MTPSRGMLGLVFQIFNTPAGFPTIVEARRAKGDNLVIDEIPFGLFIITTSFLHLIHIIINLLTTRTYLPIVQEFAKFYKELVSHRLKDVIIKASGEIPHNDEVLVAG